MNQVLLALQVLISVALIGTIAIQAKGTGLGSSFGGGGEMYRSKKGVEKVVSNATIALTVLFALVSIALLVTR